MKPNEYAEANNKFNDVVAKMFAKGYVINTAMMSGTQGELAKLDFANKTGSKVIRIVMNKYWSWQETPYGSYVCTIREYEFKKGVDYKETSDERHTLWQDDEHFVKEHYRALMA